jgi:aminopeptidase N
MRNWWTNLLLLASLWLAACSWPTLAAQPGKAGATEIGSAGLGDPIYPHLGNGGYDVTHYAIKLEVDMASNTITGTTTIQAQATLPLRRFNLDFLGLAIDAIRVNSLPARFERTGSELTATPATPLASGQPFSVTVAYHGQPTPISDDPAVPRAYGAIGWLRLRPGVFVISEPSGAMTWFPGNHHPSDKASYTITITVAKPYLVAANGLLIDEIDHGATRTYVWAESKPLASHLATLAIAEFEVMTDQGPRPRGPRLWARLPIRHYLPPRPEGSRPPVMVDALRETPALLRFFTELLGPYPFEAYGVAVIDDPQVQIGLEAQTLTILPTHRVAHEQLHELAHQWFGDSVTPATWQDTWLNEGFATYSEWLWVEQTEGQAAFDRLLRTQYTRMVRAQMGPPALPPPDQLFSAPVYIRGAWSLHALRLRIGDDAFFALLRAWVTRYRYSNASTADFIALAEEVSGRRLADFVKSWLYDDPVPPLPEG